MTGPDPLHYGWWLASRSAGIVSILAVSVSVIIGLLMANGLPKRGWAGITKRKLVAVHESTALAGMVAITVHGLTLMGDKFMHPTLSQIAVPFTMGYRPGFTGLGIIAGWLAIFLGLSFYARRYVGVKRWRTLHRATIAVWALGVVHALGSGTDASQTWLQAILVVTGIPIVYLFLRRILPQEGGRAPASVPTRSPGERLAAVERRAINHRLHPHREQAEISAARRTRETEVVAMSAGVVIAGGGLAAQRSAEALRRGGYEGRVRIVSNELHAPYDRPPLSKDFLSGEREIDDLLLRPADWHGDNDVELVLGDAAAGLDVEGRRLLLESGRALDFEHLIIATGSRPRMLPGSEGYTNVYALRSLDDSIALRKVLRPGARLAVLGAGLIGQEVAATAGKAGVEVTLIEAEQLPLGRALHPELAEWIVAMQREEGVNVLLGVRVEQLIGEGDTLRGARAQRRHARRARRAAGRDRDRSRHRVGRRRRARRRAPTPTSTSPATRPAATTGSRRRIPAGRSRSAILGKDPLPMPVTTWWSDVHGVRIQGLGDPLDAGELQVDGDMDARSFTAVALPRRCSGRGDRGGPSARGATVTQAVDRSTTVPLGGQMTLVPDHR